MKTNINLLNLLIISLTVLVSGCSQAVTPTITIDALNEPAETLLSSSPVPSPAWVSPGEFFLFNTALLDDEDKVELMQSLYELLGTEERLPPADLLLGIVDVSIEDSWGVIEVTMVDNQGDSVVGEGTVYLAKFQDATWEIAIPGSDTYKQWLMETPTSLIPEDLKTILQ